MIQTKYTFLLPAFKAKFFEEALVSLRAQKYADFKVIVSDDCSPEDLKSHYDKVIDNDPRFEYRRNKENMGAMSLVSHWNLLVEMCDTEYLIMASDDDVYEPEFLRKIDELTEKYPNVDIFRAKARRVDNDEVTKEDDDIPEYLTQEEFLEYFGMKPMVHCLANYVFKTAAMKRMGAFPDFPTAAKSDSATAIYLSKNGIVTTKDILFSFRVSNDNLSSNNGYAKNAVRTCLANLMFADWYKENFGMIYPYKSFIENIVYYLMGRMPFKECVYFTLTFRKRGYLQGLKPLLTISKNWLKLNI